MAFPLIFWEARVVHFQIQTSPPRTIQQDAECALNHYRNSSSQLNSIYRTPNKSALDARGVMEIF